MNDEAVGGETRRAIEAFAGVTFVDGNRVNRLKNGTEIFPAMLGAIRKATKRIDFVTFVYWTGDVAQQFAYALAERAAAGVEVNVLLDAVGARLMKQTLIDQLEDAGATVRFFRPVTRWKVWETDHRTHRKILAIDDDVAFTGGVGIAEEWEGDARHPGEWRDSHFQIEGPAVDQLRSAFVADWRDTGPPMFQGDIPERPQQVGSSLVGVVDASAQIELNAAGRVLELVVRMVERRLWITTPYFNPTERLRELLIHAAERGVDVRIMIPGPHIDKRLSQVVAEAQGEGMIERGVKFFRFQPTMLHLKQLVADDEITVVGSVNINERSVHKDEEVCVVVVDSEFNTLLADDFEEDQTRCEPVTTLDSLDRSPVARATAIVTRPFRGEF